MELSKVDEVYETKMVAFEMDCNDGKGDATACHSVGEFFSVVKDDRARASNVYTRNCSERNYAPSCFNLGKLFLSGRGVEQNDDKAEQLFDQACKNGHLQGCYHQAMLMFLQPEDAQEVAPGSKEHKRQLGAIKLLEASCAQGETDSCYFAGSFYLNKKEKDRNPKKAVGLLEKACKSSHAPSCFNLAVLYKNGDSDIAKSEELFQQYKTRTNELVKLYGAVSGQRAS